MEVETGVENAALSRPALGSTMTKRGGETDEPRNLKRLVSEWARAAALTPIRVPS